MTAARDTIPCPPPDFDEDEAWAKREFARLDARPRFASTGRLWKHAVAMTCRHCGHDFLADSTDLRPEMCPECGR